MRMCERTVSIPYYLDEIIEEAARRAGVSVSEFILEATTAQMLTREVAERDAWEKAQGIDRAADLEAADLEMQEDLIRLAKESGNG